MNSVRVSNSADGLENTNDVGKDNKSFEEENAINLKTEKNEQMPANPPSYDTYRAYNKENPAYESNGSIRSKKSVKDDKKADIPPVGFVKLFTFSTACDRIMIFIAILASMGTGVTWPLMIWVFGGSTDSLAQYQYFLASLRTNLSSSNISVSTTAGLNDLLTQMQSKYPQYQVPSQYDIIASMSILSQNFAEIGVAMMILSYLSVTLLVISAQKQISTLRVAYFRAVMRQNVGWFDEQKSGTLNNILVDDINAIHDGIGDKMGQMFQWLVVAIGGIILAFVQGWKLTLVALSVSPLLMAASFLMNVFMRKLNQSQLKAYGAAGSVAEEVLGAIRTVVSFRGEQYELKRYTERLTDACVAGTKKGAFTGSLLGVFNGLLFASYALGFWYGAKLVREEGFSVGKMLIVFFSCLMGSMGIGQALPHLNTLTKARTAAANVFQVIDRVPEIDKYDESGTKLADIQGKISFTNVEFAYPTRKDCTVLKNLTLNIDAGQTVALVGASGCGKSSIIQLIQRFYDITKGTLQIDSTNIKDFNLKWLREHIGVVSQEPVLFACSIKENIRYGRMDVTDSEIEEAISMANAKEFIDKLPEKLDTQVGDRGTQLSGGQKQRIAIARALVRNPKILLLDEATSALDTESERIVQEALDKACVGRTTIIVAHRLSTVRNADVIFGIKDGAVVEFGNHKELLALNGLYKELVDRQALFVTDESEEENLKQEEIDTLSEESPKHPPSNIIRENTNVSSTDLEANNVNEKQAKPNHFLRVMKLGSPERGLIFLGCIGAMFNGASQPAFAVLFGYLVPAMANPDMKQQEHDIMIYVITMACIAAVTFAANIVQSFFFSKAGEKLTMTCRRLTFQAMLRQDIAWFDDPDNNLGALTTRLSQEASAIRGASGENFGTVCQALFSMGAALVISFVYAWEVALLIIGFVPFLLLGGVLHIKIMQGFSNKDSMEISGKIAVESIENIRTVTNLTREETFIKQYNDSIAELNENIMKKAHVQGFLFGLTQGTIFCAYAAIFFLAAYLMSQGRHSMSDIFIAFGALMFAAMYVGNAMAMAPNYNDGKKAADSIFKLLDRVPPIDSYSTDGVPINVSDVIGNINLEAVHFCYPLRPNISILKGLSTEISSNTTVALVGSSGCGKSTVIQLLQRFYHWKKGQITVDGTKVDEIQIKRLREMFSIVSQEPVLFSSSIRENIAYADEESVGKMEQIEAVARAANVHDFISSLPEKYETNINERGSNLSGGQKQRIAIARALFRNPKILLLDEATSALDSESEKIVQEALDRAQEGRTCIVIAHRLSTIQNANKIVVLKDGKVAEVGTHSELITRNGLYANLVKMQKGH